MENSRKYLVQFQSKFIANGWMDKTGAIEMNQVRSIAKNINGSIYLE